MVPFWSCGPAPGGSRRRSITGFPFFVFGGKKLGGRAHARGAHGAGSAPGRRRVSWRAGRCRGAPRLTELCAPRPVALAAASITGFLFFGGKPSGLLRPTNRPFAAAAAAARSDGGTERSGWGSIATSHALNGQGDGEQRAQADFWAWYAAWSRRALREPTCWVSAWSSARSAAGRRLRSTGGTTTFLSSSSSSFSLFMRIHSSNRCVRLTVYLCLSICFASVRRFGKTGEDEFTLLCGPLPPLQGFAIACSSVTK
jgi:hypothetical protein